MNTTTDAISTIKRGLLESAGDEQKFTELLKSIDINQLKEIQQFFWDLVIEQSQPTKTPITRRDIISAIEPASKFQQRARCKEPIGYCTISLCMRTDPQCAANRILGIMKSLRSMLAAILSERPELLSTPIETLVFSQNGTAPTASPLAPDGEIISDPESAMVATEACETPSLTEPKENMYAKYKPTLWSMIEFEGLDHAILMTTDGEILEHASSAKADIGAIAQVISSEIYAVIEQGEAANFKPLLTVTKEFKKGVIAIRWLGGNIYLVGISETVLPGKIHSLIVRLGNQLKEELDVTQIPEA